MIFIFVWKKQAKACIIKGSKKKKKQISLELNFYGHSLLFYWRIRLMFTVLCILFSYSPWATAFLYSNLTQQLKESTSAP